MAAVTTTYRLWQRLSAWPGGSRVFSAAITDGADVVVPVSVVDKSGVEVVHADITCRVTPA